MTKYEQDQNCPVTSLVFALSVRSFAGLLTAIALTWLATSDCVAAEMDLEHEVLICTPETGEHVTTINWIQTAMRGYESIGFAVNDNKTGSSKWVVIDDSRYRPINVIEDFRILAGKTAGEPHQQITAVSQLGQIIATTTLPNGADSQAYIYRGREFIGKLPTGWRIVGFDHNWRGKLWVESDEPGWYRNRHACAIAIAQYKDQPRFQLYGILKERTHPLGIEGGPALHTFYAKDDMLYFRDESNRIMQKQLDSDSPATELFPNGSNKKQGHVLEVIGLRTTPGLAELYRDDCGPNARPPLHRYLFNASNGNVKAVVEPPNRIASVGKAFNNIVANVDPACIDQWHRTYAWAQGLWSKAEQGGEEHYTQLRQQEGLDEGFLVFSRRSDQGHDLYLLRPSVDEQPSVVGQLKSEQFGPLSKIIAVRLTYSGDLLVLAKTAEGNTILQWYDCLMANEFRKVRNEAQSYWVEQRDWTVQQINTISSLYKYDDFADRGYDSMKLASDGNIYFATMPHDFEVGTLLYKYDTSKNKIEVLGDFDKLVGQTPGKHVPNMAHVIPIELNGKLYFTGQDPFYGRRHAPGWHENTPVYLGSAILMYDIKSGQFTNLGIPVPDDKSIFEMVGHPKRNSLFFRAGYSGGNWYEQKLSDDGSLLGEPIALPNLESASYVMIASDGKLYHCTAPNRDPKSDSWIGAPGAIHCFDPETNSNETVAAVDVEALHDAPLQPQGYKPFISAKIHWVNGCQGSQKLIGVVNSLGTVVQFDTQTHELQSFGLLRPNDPHPFRFGVRAQIAGDHVVGFFRHDEGDLRGTRVAAVNLVTGKKTDLGVMRDQHGRWFQYVTQAETSADGKQIFLGGQIHNQVGDKYSGRRSRFYSFAGYDSVFCILDLNHLDQ